jgi:hypothetical protein
MTVCTTRLSMPSWKIWTTRQRNLYETAGYRFTVENCMGSLDSCYFGVPSTASYLAMSILVVNTVLMKSANAEFESDASGKRNECRAACLETAWNHDSMQHVARLFIFGCGWNPW